MTAWRSRLMIGLALILARAPLLEAQNCSNTSRGFTPLTDLGLGTYQGQAGGLYPGGANVRPWAHEVAGLDIATGQILPRNASGAGDLANGRIVFASLGMSNTSQEFQAFLGLAPTETHLNPRVTLVNGAQGGMTASRWAAAPNPADQTNPWTVFASRIASAGATGMQLQVVWLKLAEVASNMTPGFPAGAQQLKGWIQQAVLNLKAQYPNVRIVYLSSRIYAGYATTSLNPEPIAYENGFSVKWLVEDQINGVPALEYRGTNPPAPWLSWGPYLWADGLGSDGMVGGIPGRSDGLEWLCSDLAADGTHPSAQGALKVAGMLMSWLKADLTSAPWFLSGPLTPTQLGVDPAATASSDGNGVFEPGEAVTVAPSWLNTSGQGVAATGAGSVFRGPEGPSYTFVDASADYGTLGPGQTADCASATGDCYAVQVNLPATRPARHWDTILHEALPTGDSKTWMLHLGDSFSDVPRSNGFYRFVETILHDGITSGCGATDYCPAGSVLRKQMAVFLLKAKLGKSYVPPPATGIFGDVPASDSFAPWIEDLYGRGITGGCSAQPLFYCPDNSVLRRQMAVLLLRTLEGSSYTPPACGTPTFGDVPCSDPFAAWIYELVARSITSGCGGGNYCPESAVNRGHMAVFLTRTFALLLYGS